MSQPSSSSAAPAKGRTYADAIEALNSLQSNAQTIEAIRKNGNQAQFVAIPEMVEYLRRIGYEPSDLNRLNVLHITGTKGKGSTSAFCSSLLRSSPQPPPLVGLYTSPHMIFVRERIRINGKPIDEETFAKHFWEVWDRLEQNPERALPTTPLRPVYFRYVTLLAFHVFLSLNVSATILEVGIGGLYDSTNIVPRPVVCGITPLGLDHTAILGNTLEEIAKQKAGIYKEGAHAVSVTQPESPMAVVEQQAQERKAASFTKLPVPSSSSKLSSIALGLPGEHQILNAQLAVQLVRRFLHSRSDEGSSQGVPSPDDIEPSTLAEWERAGLEGARWPGRCQLVPTQGKGTFYLDGAHTTDSLRLAAKWFVDSQPENAGGKAKRILVFNCTNGRNATGLLEALLQGAAEALKAQGREEAKAQTLFGEAVFTTNTTYNSGSSGDLTSAAIDPSDLSGLVIQKDCQAAWQSLVPSSSSSQTRIVASIEEALKACKPVGEAEQTHVLVVGSLHLVGGVMAHLQDWGEIDEELVAVRRA